MITLISVCFLISETTSLYRFSVVVFIYLSGFSSWNGFVVPDMSIQGTLSTLAASIDLEQYKLIKGLLSFNIGECIDDITPLRQESLPQEVSNAVICISTTIK